MALRGNSSTIVIVFVTLACICLRSLVSLFALRRPSPPHGSPVASSVISRGDNIADTLKLRHTRNEDTTYELQTLSKRVIGLEAELRNARDELNAIRRHDSVAPSEKIKTERQHKPVQVAAVVPPPAKARAKKKKSTPPPPLLPHWEPKGFDRELSYWNLSCPLEWSKYSCVHHSSDINKPAAAESYKFAWGRSENRELLLEAIGLSRSGLLQGRRVLIVGDSLSRQVFISLGCILGQQIEYVKVPWIDWPCRGVANCVRSGEHSGFDTASFKIKGGGEVHFTPHAGALIEQEPNILDRWADGMHSVFQVH